MALTPYELANTLRLFGVGILDQSSPRGIALSVALASLTADQELVFKNEYYDKIVSLEKAMIEASLDADTKRAGPWERNLLVGDELRAAYDDLLRRLGMFIGIPIGYVGDAPPVVFVV